MSSYSRPCTINSLNRTRVELKLECKTLIINRLSEFESHQSGIEIRCRRPDADVAIVFESHQSGIEIAYSLS